MKTIGIIGGGQLGMFLAIAAYEMGYETIVYDCKEDCCAKNIASKFVLGSFDDEQKLESFAKECDVITYEFENINSDLVKKLSLKYPIVQTEKPLVLSSSRLNERKMADKLNINQPKWQFIESKEDIKNIEITYPYLLKSDSLGYDGKGQYMINCESDLDKVVFDNVVYLAEKKIDFDYELSIIACRSINDEIIIYEPFVNDHHKGILNITLIQQAIKPEILKQANQAIEKIMADENIYGILCCEFFIKDNKIYFNEMAPRPHNSGHITMDTHYISQYENHLRAILGLPLGTTKIKCSGFMVNVLGQDVDKTKEFVQKHGSVCKYYDYHKEAKYNRKVGHLIVFDDDYLKYFKETWK
ncbi:5-(carboxyamino)imidazole ribonucleotide synthase [Bacilli bacterium PM5-3]|nr:5-(carboxyamino)imidazole ribonucleotide synthase [Bacilli bacterium PM5-3]